MRPETNGLQLVSPSRQLVNSFAVAGWDRFNFRTTACSPAQELTTRLDLRPVCFKLIGEFINEDQIILGGEESTGISIKGDYSKKNGVVAPRSQAQAVASRQSFGAPIRHRIADSR